MTQASRRESHYRFFEAEGVSHNRACLYDGRLSVPELRRGKPPASFPQARPTERSQGALKVGEIADSPNKNWPHNAIERNRLLCDATVWTIVGLGIKKGAIQCDFSARQFRKVRVMRNGRGWMNRTDECSRTHSRSLICQNSLSRREPCRGKRGVVTISIASDMCPHELGIGHS